MAQSKIQMPETKTILNIALAIGLFIGGKSLLEALGLLKTKDDKIADQLETESGGNVQDTSPNAPAGLSLNPNYWKNIFANIQKEQKAKKLPILTGKQAVQLLFFENKPINNFSFKDLFKLENTSPLNLFSNLFKQADYIALQKKLGLSNSKPFEWINAYLFLAYNIYNAKGLFKDNPESVNAIFQKLNSRAKVSYLSEIFTRAYGIDFQTYLASFLDTTEMTKLANYLKNKKFV
jgi:hypothetical protein